MASLKRLNDEADDGVQSWLRLLEKRVQFMMPEFRMCLATAIVRPPQTADARTE